MEVLVLIVVAAVAVFLWKVLSAKKAEPPQELRPPAPSPQPRPMSQPQDDGKDAWEEWDYMGAEVASTGKELTRRLKIRFTDKDGQKTEREIDTKRFLADDKDGVLQAFCHLRQANRPFRLSRVSHAVDLDTGEVLQDLPAWLAAQYANTPRGQADAFIDAHGDALSALLFVAKADGAFRQAEREHLAEFCRGLEAPSGEVVEVVVGDVGGWAVPSAIAYGKALRGAAGKPEAYRQSILDTARKMVDSDKTAKDDETKALGRMAKELGIK
jgi:uncharacterized tellurite resistance protein B-like protein